MTRICLLLAVSLVFSAAVSAQDSSHHRHAYANLDRTPPPIPTTPKVYPTNWWIGMHYSKPELMIHCKDLGNAANITLSYPGVTLTDWRRAESPNYLFLHLNISPDAHPGTLDIVVQPKAGGQAVHIPFSILPRRRGNGSVFAKGVTS